MARIPSAEQILQIVEARTAERIDLEFKALPWDRSDSGKKEALKDITALANTRGGLILVGIVENSNAAASLAPLSAADAESERARLHDLIRAGVEPRLYGVEIEAVSVDGGAVLAISIARSPSRPHRVTSGNSNRFWVRNATSAYEPNVSDLRTLFLQSAENSERAARYHRDRLGLVRNSEIVANMSGERGSIIMHLIPADAFSSASMLDPRRAYELQNGFLPMGASSFTPRFTFDGFLNFRGGQQCHGYTLVGRNGIVEATKIGIGGSDTSLLVYRVEATIIAAAHKYAATLIEAGVAPPFYAYVTLEGVGGRRIVYDGYGSDDGIEIAHEDLHLPAALIETTETKSAVGAAFRPAFDALWNAGGMVGSASFVNDIWVERAR